MRQLTTIILFILSLLIISVQPSFCAVKGGIEYSIPVDYSKLSETEILEKAKVYYHNAEQVKDGIVNEDVTNALFTYSVLQNINPENIEYSIKLGKLYEKIGKDRYAKGNYARAIGVNPSKPDGYFCYGEYYYKKQQYRRALKYFNEAYKKGYQTDYDTLYKLGDIYEKFGDTRSALKYLKDASVQNPNSELDNKIKQVENQDSINQAYYSQNGTKYDE